MVIIGEFTLNEFTKKWTPCEINGWKLLNMNVLKELKLLEVHISKGCLSGKPVHAGTNRNERLHRHLKPHFSFSRLGLPMALALMTLLLYQYNSKVMEKMGASPITTTGKFYHFGITSKEVDNTTLPSTETMTRTNCIHLLDHSFFNEASKPTTLNESISRIISVEEIMNILENAVHLYNLTNKMNLKSSSLFRYQFFPFMSSISSLFFGNLKNNSDLR